MNYNEFLEQKKQILNIMQHKMNLIYVKKKLTKNI